MEPGQSVGPQLPRFQAGSGRWLVKKVQARVVASRGAFCGVRRWLGVGNGLSLGLMVQFFTSTCCRPVNYAVRMTCLCVRSGFAGAARLGYSRGGSAAKSSPKLIQNS